jgi:CheY-like chemotaxis protein
MTRDCILMMADDDPDDREFVKEAFESSGFRGKFRYVEDGGALVDYLFRAKDDPDGRTFPMPDLILLDLNMPRIDGHEALKRIKSDAGLKSEIQRTYDEGVNSFITKPSGFSELVDMASHLRRYWLEFVKLPTGGME